MSRGVVADQAHLAWLASDRKLAIQPRSKAFRGRGRRQRAFTSNECQTSVTDQWLAKPAVGAGSAGPKAGGRALAPAHGARRLDLLGGQAAPHPDKITHWVKRLSKREVISDLLRLPRLRLSRRVRFTNRFIEQLIDLHFSYLNRHPWARHRVQGSPSDCLPAPPARYLGRTSRWTHDGWL